MDTKITLQQKLNKIQQELKVAKAQRNTFANYNYRSCEDIIEAVKLHLGDLTLVITDEVVIIGERYYIKATACLADGKDTLLVSAFAREQDDKKGMDAAQITGAASSYARKYALSGLFAIDNTEDADTMDNTKEEEKTKGSKTSSETQGHICPIHNVALKRFFDHNASRYVLKHSFPLQKDDNGVVTKWDSCFGEGFASDLEQMQNMPL